MIEAHHGLPNILAAVDVIRQDSRLIHHIVILISAVSGFGALVGEELEPLCLTYGTNGAEWP